MVARGTWAAIKPALKDYSAKRDVALKDIWIIQQNVMSAAPKLGDLPGCGPLPGFLSHTMRTPFRQA